MLRPRTQIQADLRSEKKKQHGLCMLLSLADEGIERGLVGSKLHSVVVEFSGPSSFKKEVQIVCRAPGQCCVLRPGESGLLRTGRWAEIILRCVCDISGG